MKTIEGGVTAAKGFEAAAAAAEIKYKNRTDMALVYSQKPCVAAGTFTTNVVKAAPVKWDQEIVYNQPYAQAVVINSGIANACTGAEGYGYCKETASGAAEILGIPEMSVLVASTGVIGMQLPIDRIKAGSAKLAEVKKDTIEAGHEAARAIMTTDTVPKEISRWVGKVGMEPRFVNGLRVTDADTMEIAEMVLNKVNKSLVQMVQELGVKAVGISGKDGGLLTVEKKYSNGEDIGFVGEITEVNPKILHDLLEKDFLPIICPVGLDKDFNTYNINADDAACAIAKAVDAEKLAFLTDIEGVYKDFEDKDSLISELTIKEAHELIEEGFIGGGMLPKLNNCIDAIDNGVSRVHIMDGRIPHCLLLEIFTNKGIGTAILGEEEGRYYHGDE